MPKLVTFHIIAEDNETNQRVEDSFTYEHISAFNSSLSDPRLIKFRIVANDVIDFKILFESVHIKHQFAELINLRERVEAKNS